jgi:hypothetical protein
MAFALRFLGRALILHPLSSSASRRKVKSEIKKVDSSLPKPGRRLLLH